jgi:hypothetical protein
MQPNFVGGHQMVMSPTESMVEKIDSWIFLALQPTRENPAISSSESAILQPQRKQKLWVQTTSHTFFFHCHHNNHTHHMNDMTPINSVGFSGERCSACLSSCYDSEYTGLQQK